MAIIPANLIENIYRYIYIYIYIDKQIESIYSSLTIFFLLNI